MWLGTGQGIQTNYNCELMVMVKEISHGSQNGKLSIR